jgi:hypothetical protein
LATQRWIGGSGVGLTWTSCFSAADINSLANNSSVLATATNVVTNGSALDIYCDVSVALGSITPAAPGSLGIYLYPLNGDGTTYGDNNFTAGTQKAATPGAGYQKGWIGAPTGSAILVKGTVTGIIMPPGSFLFCIQNTLGVALAASANTIYYRTYNLQVT